MPELPVVKPRQVFAALERAGFVRVSQRGSHVKMRRGDALAIVPDHGRRDVQRGTLKSILEQAGLTIDEFKDLLRG